MEKEENILKDTLGRGYLQVGLDRHLYQQHRIIAQKLITNLENLP